MNQMAMWIAAAAILLVVGIAAGRSTHPVRTILVSALAGISALGAVNMLAPFTGVGIPLNWFTSFVAVVLGAPGVIGVLLLNVLLQV